MSNSSVGPRSPSTSKRLRLIRAVALAAVVLLVGYRVYSVYLPAALFKAAASNNSAATERAIHFGADPNQIRNGRSVLEEALLAGCFDTAELLLRHGAMIRRGRDGLLLNSAAQGGRLDLVRTLVERGADVNAPPTNGQTPLMAAVLHPKVVRYLLDKGANPNAENFEGETALVQAVIWTMNESDPQRAEDRLNSVRTLLARSANVNHKTWDYSTVHQVVWRGPGYYLVTVHGRLIEPARDIQLRSKRLNIQLQLLDALFQHGADPNEVDGRGLTPLMQSILYGQSQEVTRSLLIHGANVMMKDRDGQTALMLAKKWNLRQQIALLEKAGAKE